MSNKNTEIHLYRFAHVRNGIVNSHSRLQSAKRHGVLSHTHTKHSDLYRFEHVRNGTVHATFHDEPVAQEYILRSGWQCEIIEVCIYIFIYGCVYMCVCVCVCVCMCVVCMCVCACV